MGIFSKTEKEIITIMFEIIFRRGLGGRGQSLLLKIIFKRQKNYPYK